MKKRIILVVTGSRAEYGILKSTMEEINKSKKLILRLLVTGQHTLKKYGNTIQTIKIDGFRIDGIVQIAEQDDMITCLAKEITGIKKYCYKIKPDLILVLGDRDEPFAAAIVAGHLKIPIAHIHGGDVTGNVVDEYIRHSITKFSHLHFAASKKSYNRILKLGEERKRIFLVGAPGYDNLKKLSHHSKKALASKIGIDSKKPWILALQHPTPHDTISLKKQIVSTLAALRPIDAEIILMYPNIDTGYRIFLTEINKFKDKSNFHIYKNFDRSVYLSILKYSLIIVGNSSSGIIESIFYSLPAVNIGSRQHSREHSKNVIHVGYDTKEIAQAIKKAISPAFKKSIKNLINPYGNGNAGKKIVKIIEINIDDKNLFYKKFTHA